MRCFNVSILRVLRLIVDCSGLNSLWLECCCLVLFVRSLDDSIWCRINFSLLRSFISLLISSCWLWIGRSVVKFKITFYRWFRLFELIYEGYMCQAAEVLLCLYCFVFCWLSFCSHKGCFLIKLCLHILFSAFILESCLGLISQ